MAKQPNPQKLARAQALLAQKFTFAQIRATLIEEFGEGMSFSTLTTLNASTIAPPQDHGELTKKLVLLMVKARVDSNAHGIDIKEEDVKPFIEQLHAEGAI